MKRITFILPALLCCLAQLSGQSRWGKLVGDASKGTEKVEKADSADKSGRKSYGKLITGEAVTARGVMTIHKVKEKYYLEIPFSLIGKPMLLAGRISQISANNDVIAGQMPRDPFMVEWSADSERLYMLDAASDAVCDPSESIARGFARNNLKPVMKAFPIAAVNPDSTAAVIEVGKFFCGDEKHLSPFTPSTPIDALFGIKRTSGSFKGDMSSILGFKAFPRNINFTTRMVYTVSDKPFTAVMTTSMILLDERPMRPRLADSRLGIFTNQKTRYSENVDRTERIGYINRWDMQPRQEDVERYRNGEKVVPRKQIVYWVDNAFPQKWRPWLKKGIEDWRTAFEAIGFRDAIVAKDFPDDPLFDPEDIRNSCLIYASTPTANAMGPSWTDPRSGEIVQGSVYFYHNVLKLLHNWRFIQTAVCDPSARAENYDMEVMGPLLRYLVAHEIGHTLGLMHNMRGSYAYPVDSLRSPSFTAKHGTTASIMDYARFNYVAQPSDGVTDFLPPLMGPYDMFAIRWAYTPIFEADSAEGERETLNGWLAEKAGDPVYMYGMQEFISSVDPASQSESLGDDAMKAGDYGIRNLRVLVDSLPAWTRREGRDWDYTREMYSEVLRQASRYVSHAVKYIGGNFLHNVVAGDNLPAFEPVDRLTQKRALDFVVNTVREMPEWLIDEELNSLFPPSNDVVYDYQASAVRALASTSMLGKVGATAKGMTRPYTQSEYLDDLYSLVWRDALRGRSSGWGGRKMEYAYVHTLLGGIDELKAEAASPARGFDNFFGHDDFLPCEYMGACRHEAHSLTASTKESDLKIQSKALYHAQLRRIQTLVASRARNSAGEEKAHYDYLSYEIGKALDGR